MRNIHVHIRSEYGLENVRILQHWERIECKMADFKNHRRFSLRCLSEDVIPVSIKLKSNIRTPKGQYIVRRAEKALLNEIIRLVNNTINMLNHRQDTCKTDLEKRIREEDMKECQLFINIRKEARHFQTMERHKQKIDRLCHKNSIGKGGCSNMHGDHTSTSMNTACTSPVHTNTMNKWVINIPSKSLTKAQEKLLAHGPNFTVVPRIPSFTEYVAVIAHACSKLQQGEAEELRWKVKTIIKKTFNHQPNITREERKAITELKKDPSRMILTADKGYF